MTITHRKIVSLSSVIVPLWDLKANAMTAMNMLLKPHRLGPHGNLQIIVFPQGHKSKGKTQYVTFGTGLELVWQEVLSMAV